MTQKIFPRLQKEISDELELHLYGSSFPQRLRKIDQVYPQIRPMSLMKSMNLMIRYKLMALPILFGSGLTKSLIIYFYIFLVQKYILIEFFKVVCNQ